MDSFAFMHLRYQQRYPKKIPIPIGVAENGNKVFGNPQDFDTVSVYYEVHLLDYDGTLVLKSHDYGFNYNLKDGHFCPALSKAVKTMEKGEKAIFIVKPQYGFGEKGKPAHGDDQASVPPNATLQITLKLFAWRKVPFLKMVFKEGEGYECPNEGAVVKLKLIGKLQDGTVFFTRGHGGDDDQAQLFEFKTNEKQVIEGLDRAVMTMTKGEVALLTIGPKYAFGSQPKSALVPPNSTVYYEVELVSFVKGKEEEKGKALDEAGEYERACKSFDKVFSAVKKTHSMGLKNYYNDRCEKDYIEMMNAMIERQKKLRGKVVLWPQ